VHEITSTEPLSTLSRQPKLHFIPGEKFEYSNSGYVVLGQIIERVSGMRYAEFMNQKHLRSTRNTRHARGG
jgi:CubicO group peptidase (beta-lactamase class C family)